MAALESDRPRLHLPFRPSGQERVQISVLPREGGEQVDEPFSIGVLEREEGARHPVTDSIRHAGPAFFLHLARRAFKVEANDRLPPGADPGAGSPPAGRPSCRWPSSLLQTPVVPDLLAPASRRLLPWMVAVVAFLMESLDTTILNTAVPTVAAALGVVPLSMKAVLSSYTLSLAVFIPVSGWVADRFGTRRVFASAIALFTLGSLLCGLSTSIHVLVACPILQGMGGALMVPVGRLTIVRTFDRSELVRAMSFVTIPALIGPMLGPVAGGLIVGYFHWPVVFFVNLPIGLFVLSLVFLAAYFRHAFAAPHPLLRLGLLRIWTFRSSVTGSFVTRLGAGGIPFLLPLLYQVGLGYTPVQSAFLLMPQSIAAMTLKPWMPRILGHFGYRRVLLANTIVMGGAIALFATIGTGTPTPSSSSSRSSSARPPLCSTPA